MQPKKTIEEVANELAERFPDTTVGIGNNVLYIYLHSKAKAEYPSQYDGYPVTVQYVGKIRLANK
jgi:hypothetical protein